MGLGNGKTDSIADTLTKRASGDLNSGGVVGLGMAGSDAVKFLRTYEYDDQLVRDKFSSYSEALNVVKRNVTIKVKEGILQHATVAVAYQLLAF